MIGYCVTLLIEKNGYVFLAAWPLTLLGSIRKLLCLQNDTTNFSSEFNSGNVIMFLPLIIDANLKDLSCYRTNHQCSA